VRTTLPLEAEGAQLPPGNRPGGSALAVTALTLAADEARVCIPDAIGIRRMATPPVVTPAWPESQRSEADLVVT
jgi:hypothetical protein